MIITFGKAFWCRHFNLWYLILPVLVLSIKEWRQGWVTGLGFKILGQFLGTRVPSSSKNLAFQKTSYGVWTQVPRTEIIWTGSPVSWPSFEKLTSWSHDVIALYLTFDCVSQFWIFDSVSCASETLEILSYREFNVTENFRLRTLHTVWLSSEQKFNKNGFTGVLKLEHVHTFTWISKTTGYDHLGAVSNEISG